MADDARKGSEAGPDGPSQAQTFLQQFDILILRVSIAGPAGALFYGASAGACRIAPATAAAASGLARCSDAPWLGAPLAFVFTMAALAVGAFAGFLFGLPRSLTANVARPEASSGEDTGASDGHSTGNARGRFQGIGSDVNTNLERISNWLTTVIVGVRLTKLEAIPDALTSFGRTVDQRAVEIEPATKALIGNLYDPARQVGDDNDLQRFFRTPEIDALLASGPRPAA